MTSFTTSTQIVAICLNQTVNSQEQKKKQNVFVMLLLLLLVSMAVDSTCKYRTISTEEDHLNRQQQQNPKTTHHNTKNHIQVNTHLCGTTIERFDQLSQSGPEKKENTLKHMHTSLGLLNKS